MKQETAKPLIDPKTVGLFILFIIVIALLTFRSLLGPSTILLTTDDNIGQLMVRRSLLPYAWTGGWYDLELMGYPVAFPLSWTNFLVWLLPLKFSMNWLHAVYLGIGSIFLACFLRLRKLSTPACILAALTAYWLGSNFTLTYAGHLGKFGVIMFASICLWLIEMTVTRKKLAWAVLAGVAMGAMFLEQADLALFFAMFLGPYAVFALVREFGFRWGRIFLLIIVMIIMAGLLAFDSIWQAYQTNVQGIASMQEDNPAKKWQFVTQWSWPPEESIDFIAPGFMGWRSGEAEGPYWGRMGRSPEWKKTGQGFRNFKLENQYLGIIPLVLACLAVTGVIAGFRKSREKRLAHIYGSCPGQGDIVFWGVAAIIALLLSFGKYFPLYALFYKLPGISSIRNPNKFLQVFQFAIGILAAYGFDLCVRNRQKDAVNAGTELQKKDGKTVKTENGKSKELPVYVPGWAGYFIWVVVGVAVIVSCWAALSSASAGSQISRFAAKGWGAYAGIIVHNINVALIQASFMLSCMAGFLWFFFYSTIRKRLAWETVKWALVLLVALDAVWLSRHYVKTLPESFINKNEIVTILKDNIGNRRAAMLVQQGFYNTWLTYLFTYQQIKTINVIQMPRMPMDYQLFLESMVREPVRLWRLGAVKLILAPAQVFNQLKQDMRLREKMDAIYAYNVFPSDDGGTRVECASAAHPGQHVIIQLRLTAPRYALVAGWEQMPDKKALENLADRNYPLFNKVMIAPESAGQMPESTGEGIKGSVTVQKYRPGYVRLRVSNDCPVILRVSEKYDPGWKALVDDHPVPVRRVDYIFQGILIDEPGVHQIVLHYTREIWTLFVQAAGMLICLAAIIHLAFHRSAKHAFSTGT